MRMLIPVIGIVLFVAVGFTGVSAQQSFAGDSTSARLAMNGYPDLAHSVEAAEGR